jgi:hypothetical protein
MELYNVFTRGTTFKKTKIFGLASNKEVIHKGYQKDHLKCKLRIIYGPT